MESQMWTLVNPPQGKSQADSYAERCNTWVYKKMKHTCSELDKEKHISATHFRKEQQKLLRELENIRRTGGSKSKELKSSKFLESERNRVRDAIDTLQKDGYNSFGPRLDNALNNVANLDGYSSECSEESFDDANSDRMSDTDSSDGHAQTSRVHSACKQKSDERVRGERLQNFHRRYSAHGNLEYKRLHTFMNV